MYSVESQRIYKQEGFVKETEMGSWVFRVLSEDIGQVTLARMLGATLRKESRVRTRLL